jgi:NADH-quinone oxidoreductase subunit M
LFFSLSSLGCAVLLLNQFNAGENISAPPMDQPTQYFICTTSRWFSNRDDPINTSINPYHYILLNEYKNAKAFYALTFMAFAMAGTFLASDGLLYYIFWELSLILFISLPSLGVMMLKNVKKAVVKFFIYTLAGSLFMLIAFVYLYQQAGSFIRRFI